MGRWLRLAALGAALLGGCLGVPQPEPPTDTIETPGRISDSNGGAMDASPDTAAGTLEDSGPAPSIDGGDPMFTDPDAGDLDAAVTDAEVVDAAVTDSGAVDAAVTDSGAVDAAVTDGGATDGAIPDAAIGSLAPDATLGG